MNKSTGYDEVNKAWKTTCKTLLKDEIGELKEYEKWLSEYVEPVNTKKSCISKKPVHYATQYYCENGRFVSLDEIDFNKRFGALDINEIKDIDSIAEAFRERFCYCGNIVLANSRNVEQSSNIHDSHFVYRSNYVYGCEYIAHSSNIKNCKYVFTDNSDCGSSFLIRCLEGFKGQRSFETWSCYNCSDCYCSFGGRSSQDVMFSFNIDNKRHMIGNLQLEKDKYLMLKEKLVAQIKEELERNRYMPSLIEMATETGKKPDFEMISGEGNETDGDIDAIDEAFRKTTRVILGKQLEGIREYGKWLSKHVPKVHEAKSCISGRKLYKSGNYPFSALPEDYLATEPEARKIARTTRLDESELESFETIRDSLWKLALFTPELRLGENRNIFETALSNTSVNCYRGCVYNDSKNSAYCFWPRNSEFMFGSQLTVDSHSGINCYNSSKISRGLELDGCGNCSDIYFSHNCENVQDSMFCFNVKNLRFGIGNAAYAPDKYQQVKEAILCQINDELESKKDLKMNIYNIGCKQ